MNDHFATVTARTLESGNFNVNIYDYLPPQQPPCFDFHEITSQNIADTISRLSSSQYCSHDGITAFMIKCAKTELLPILTYLFNRSLTLRVFPSIWKDAIMTPLFKSGSHDNVGNYRPISVLSTISKLLERCVHDQCYSYLTSHDLLMTTCLINFLDNIYREVDGGGCLWGHIFGPFENLRHCRPESFTIETEALGFQSICSKLVLFIFE